MTPSLEGWRTKAKEAPSPHEVRLALLDTNPVLNGMLLKDHLIEFLEYFLFNQYVFDYRVVDKCQTTSAIFVEKLYCTCELLDLGELLK